MSEADAIDKVDLDGTLDRAEQLLENATSKATRAQTISFEFLGRTFRAMIHQSDRHSEVHVEGALGALPYSAEDRESRTGAIDLIGEANAIFRCRYFVDRHGQVKLSARTRLDHDADEAQLREALVVTLLDLRTHAGLLMPLLRSGH